ncbi:LysR family transcriptional regulator [Aliiroseovarius sp. 2305UL8-7]|uniref:LysR family transcriptional regulator n=1 Tax=Aliiroseovarius conchicola TaxID=3121637 RepID=UPI0035277BA0
MERGLHQFFAVAETGSISAAAKRLNVTQPTITVNIRNLEEKYQVPLFERNPRGMVLTPFGSILFEKTRIMARLEAQASREIENRRLGAGQLIGIGCGHAWWPLFVREAVENLSNDMPSISVSVENGSNLHCMWKLLAGEVMLSVGHRIPNLAPGVGAEFTSLFRVTEGHFVAKGHPLLARNCTIDDLAGLYWINSVPTDRQYSEILTVSEDNKYERISNLSGCPTYSSNSLLTCADMVRQTQGYIVFPLDMAAKLEELGLVPLLLEDEPDRNEVGIYVLSERQKDPTLVSLVDCISASAKHYVSTRRNEILKGF